MWHGDRRAQAEAQLTLPTSRFGKAALALAEVGLDPIAVIYNDDFADEVLAELLTCSAVQVWVNPIEGERDRKILDQTLTEAANKGVLVQTDPETIMKMGTKQVLVDTKDMSWGSDVHAYESLDQMRAELPARLEGGRSRVLKQFRGHSGGGIWKIGPSVSESGLVTESTLVRLRHAQRGTPEEVVSLEEAILRMAPYFERSGKMIDQAYQVRLAEGMIRIYMVADEVAGFGHQAINALYPMKEGGPSGDQIQAGPRLYYGPDEPEFQPMKSKMESDWIHGLRETLGLKVDELPLLWDADLMFGPRDENGKDTYVLCEINVSCVSPYPESANPFLARVLLDRITRRQK